MGRPVRRTPEEWKASKKFWGGVQGVVASVFILYFSIPLIFKLGFAVTQIKNPSPSQLVVVFIVGAVVLVVGLAFR